MAGRPTKMDDITIKKLEDAFMKGCTDLEACLAADISHETLYAYCRENKAFSERKEILKRNPAFIARDRLLEQAKTGKDTKTLRWLVDKLDGKPKQAIEHSGDVGFSVTRKSYDNSDT